MPKLKNSAESAQDVYRAGGELYHLQAARREHGDARVLSRLAAAYRTRDGLSPSDACIRAGQYLNDVDHTINRNFGFKKMRAELDAERARQNSADSGSRSEAEFSF